MTLTVSDRKVNGLTDSTTLAVNVGNTPPPIAFTSPTNGQGYAVGVTLPVAFALSDAESPVVDLTVEWRVLIHHIGHLHYLPLNTSQSGSFDVPDHGDDFFLE